MSKRLRNVHGARLARSQSPPTLPHMEEVALTPAPYMRSLFDRLQPMDDSILGIQERQRAMGQQAAGIVAELQVEVRTTAQQSSMTAFLQLQD